MRPLHRPRRGVINDARVDFRIGANDVIHGDRVDARTGSDNAVYGG